MKSDGTGEEGKVVARHARPHSRNLLREALEFVVIIVAALVLTVLIRTFVLDQYEIPTGSMQPTIEINDRVFAEKVSYHFSAVNPGDIVTFDNPYPSADKHDAVLIKRVIATEGQIVDFKDGLVVVDGEILEEPYTHGLPSEPLSIQYPGVELSFPYQVPQGEVWVMGDNRINSLDSRYFGPIEEEHLLGRAILRIWPLNRFGTL